MFSYLLFTFVLGFSFVYYPYTRAVPFLHFSFNGIFNDLPKVNVHDDRLNCSRCILFTISFSSKDSKSSHHLVPNATTEVTLAQSHPNVINYYHPFPHHKFLVILLISDYFSPLKQYNNISNLKHLL